MFERFTGDARQVVVTAQEEARQLQHNHIGTEHVLLGLFAVPDSAAGRALRQVGLSREGVVGAVESIVGRGTATSGGHIPFTPRAKKVLELALRESRKLKHNYIGTEHILLGIVREGKGVAAQILTQRVQDLAAVRGAVFRHMSGTTVETIPPAPRPAKTTTAAEEVIAAAEALAGGASVGSHHLLEALARTEGSMAAQILNALGVRPEAIATQVDELDPDATTDATPEETAARRMELHVDQDAVHLILRDETTVELARKVTDLAGGPVAGTGPVTGTFVPLWAAVNQVLVTLLGALESEPEREAKDAQGKASLMMAKVMRDRLQQRLRGPQHGQTGTGHDQE